MSVTAFAPRQVRARWGCCGICLGGADILLPTSLVGPTAVLKSTSCVSSTTGKRVLICGDGDLSYGASVGRDMAERGVHLTVSVLETHQAHQRVYGLSEGNTAKIEGYGHAVRFETDATKLETYDDLCAPFDYIQFNFPHSDGKMNIARNRKLLNEFFASCNHVLKTGGFVRVALMSRQGGAFARTLADWKNSWKPAQYAAEHGLLLVDVLPFQMNYATSAYRFEDKPFHIRGDPQLYIFAAAGAIGYRVPRHLEMYCHYQVNARYDNPRAHVEIEWAVSLERGAQCALPSGWRAQTKFISITDGSKLKYPIEGKLASFQMLFFGERKPMTRDEAQRYRVGAVADALEKSGVDLALRGSWRISNVYPCSIMGQYGAGLDSSPSSLPKNATLGDQLL